MEPEDIKNPDNSELGDSGAMPQNGGEPASFPPPDPGNQNGQLPGVSTVSLLAPALQAASGETVTLNKDGTPRRKPGRKPGQKTGEGVTAQNVTPKATVPKTAAQVKAQTMTSEQTARMVINASVGAMVEMVGPEWDFQDALEADTMKTVVTAYIDAKGGAAMSPEAMLLLALAGYGLPRAKEPNTREKFASFFGGVWKAIAGAFKR